jgi:hypothetical protein
VETVPEEDCAKTENAHAMPDFLVTPMAVGLSQISRSRSMTADMWLARTIVLEEAVVLTVPADVTQDTRAHHAVARVVVTVTDNAWATSACVTWVTMELHANG